MEHIIYCNLNTLLFMVEKNIKCSYSLDTGIMGTFTKKSWMRSGKLSLLEHLINMGLHPPVLYSRKEWFNLGEVGKKNKYCWLA